MLETQCPLIDAVFLNSLVTFGSGFYGAPDIKLWPQYSYNMHTKY